MGLYHISRRRNIVDADADVDNEIRSTSPGTISCEIGLKLRRRKLVEICEGLIIRFIAFGM